MNSMPDCIRILICDDSRAYREAMRWFIEHDPDLCVADAVATGEQALERLERVDVSLVLMDLELPGMDGVEAVRRIMARHPIPILMLSAQTKRGSAQAAHAMAAGAIDARSKTEVSPADPMSARGVAFRRYLKRLAYARISGNRQRASSTPSPPVREISVAASVIAIAASTGGPRALEQVLRALPADFPVPVLALQHITTGFLDGLLTWLDEVVRLPVRVPRDGQPLQPGIWFAPEDAHLVVDRGGILRFDRHTVGGWHRPSADVLFTSVAASVGPGAVGVILTGMGSDGADGVAAIRAGKGFTIAQDESTSAIYGMPRAAAEQGADLILPLKDIGPTLASLQRRTPVR